jgi:hypothetical protein
MYAFAAFDPFTRRAGLLDDRREDRFNDVRDRFFPALRALRPVVDDLVDLEEDLVSEC